MTLPHSLTAHPSGPLNGRVRVPGDKSISHRSLILGALATGRTRIEGLLEADDVLATARAVEALGARVARPNGAFEVTGRGVGGFSQPAAPLDFGNSGTGARLIMGVCAGHAFRTRLTGDESLSRRPMARVLDPLTQMGLQVEEAGKANLPLTVRGSRDLVPIEYALPVPSAQVKSAVLLAGLHAAGETSVIERLASRDHTERMLRHFGAELVETETEGGRRVTVKGDAELTGAPITVPGDPSSAAFLVAAALICPGSDLMVEGVLANPSRIGFYETLRDMGADVRFENARDEGGEPVVDIAVRAGGLRGTTVPASRAPSMIDEFPVLAAVAAFAEGETRMQGLAELRVKESDRLAATANGLARCGVEATIEKDDLIVAGGRGRATGGGLVETRMDHRIAMAFLTLGLGAARPVMIDDDRMIASSFPTFAPLMTSLGARLEA